MLFLIHASALSAPCLFITAVICKMSKMCVICKLASHRSPSKTLPGLAVFAKPNVSPRPRPQRFPHLHRLVEAEGLGFLNTVRKKPEAQSREIQKLQTLERGEGAWLRGSLALLPSRKRRNYTFQVAKRCLSSIPRQSSQRH